MSAEELTYEAEVAPKQTIEGNIAEDQRMSATIIPKGNDGFSPLVETREIEGGYVINITDITGVHTAVVKNGEKGDNGTFIAEYGVSTWNEISFAVAEKKAVFARKEGLILPLNAISASGIWFSGCLRNVTQYSFRVTKEGWTEYTEPANKVFYAEYGVTAQSEILEHYNKGHACFCVKDTEVLPFVCKNTEALNFGFAGIINGKLTEWRIRTTNENTEEWVEKITELPPIMVVNHTFAPGGGTADKTHEEIYAAYNAGNMVLLYAGNIYLASDTGPGGTVYFGTPLTASGPLYKYSVDSSDTWSRSGMTNYGHVTQINENSTDGNVPTAKAVYDFVNANANEITATTDEKLEDKAEVFYAQYGVTTIAEVKAAVDAGKIVYVRVSVDGRDQLLPLMGADTDYSDLTFADFTFGGIVYRKLCFYKVTANGWLDQSIKIARFITESRDDNTLVTTHGIATYFEENNNIFVAEYGVTTHAEIYEASQAGKVCFCCYNGVSWLPLRSSVNEPGATRFCGYIGNRLCTWKVSLDNEWSESYVAMSDAVTAESADDSFPTSKAVYDFVTEQLGAIEAGSGGGLVVTVTATTSGDPGNQTTTYSLDATYEDIMAAIDANQLVVLRRDVSRYGYQYYLFNSYQSNGVTFRSVMDFNGTYEVISAYSDGSVTHFTYDNPGGGSSSSESVLYIAQSLTDEQKAQARENIGAPSADHTHDYVPTSRTVNGKALSGNISLSSSDVGAATSNHNHDGSYFKRYDLNAINVDSTDGNWTVDISEGGHGTVPEVWVNVQQFTSGHFRTQVARKCDTSTDATRKGTRTWTRNKYTGGVWSVWEKIYTESDCATNGIVVQSATVSDTLKVSGTSTMGRIDASNEYLTGSLYVGGKKSTSDGKTGVAFGASGNITMQGSSEPALNFNVGTATSARSKIFANANTLSFHYNGGTTTNYGFNLSTVALYPNTASSGGITLGTSDRRWSTIFTNTTVNTSSDRNLKTDIEPIDQRYVELFDKLVPVSYKLIGGNHDRDHLGFISQDVKAAMDEVGLSDMEFGGYCRDQKHETVVVDKITVINDKGEEEEVEVTAEQPVLDENGKPVYSYSLRYGEFIALNSKMIQLSRETIKAQQETIAKLQEKLAELEAKLNAI